MTPNRRHIHHIVGELLINVSPRLVMTSSDAQ
ncbi:hypothetical protein BO443_250026 [Burkholderia orbicola]